MEPTDLASEDGVRVGDRSTLAAAEEVLSGTSKKD